MSLKNICSIPRSWSLEEYRRHHCGDGSHVHLSHAQILLFEKKGLVVWLKHPAVNSRDSGVCVIVDHVNELDSLEWLGSPINTGLSSRVGEYLAVEIYRKRVWANVMLSEITGSKSKTVSVDP